MTTKEFQKELSHLLPLVLTFASDFFNLKQYKKPDEAFKKIGRENFVNKCHEGFKLAQDRIVDLLIDNEKEQNLLKNKITKIKQIINHRDIENNEEYKELNEKNYQLFYQQACLREIVNTIAWTIFKLDRIKIKSLQEPDMNRKSLLESNIFSLIEAAKFYNKDNSKFALITDITSCLGMGDMILIDTKKNSLNIVEMKEGKINKIILESLYDNLEIAKKHIESLKENENKLKFFKQFERVLKQHKKYNNALNYAKTNIGHDLFTGRQKVIIESNLREIKFINIFYDMLKKVYSQTKEDELYFPFDCGTVAIIRNPSLSKKWDFQHFIFHLLNSEKKCQYTEHEINPEIFNKPDVAQHFKDILSIPLYNFKQKIFEITHEPIFFNIPIEQAIDLMVGKLDVYNYFDKNAFFNFCSKLGLNPMWEDYEKSMKGEKQFIRNNTANFNGKLLSYGTKTKRLHFTNGLLFRMVYEFQTPESVIKQMKLFVQHDLLTKSN